MKPVSASQVGTYRQCPRRWWYESVLGRRSPPTESMLAGTKLHAILENYLRHGTWPAAPEWITIWNPARTKSRDVELVALAKLGLPHLPPAGVATVEGRFTYHVGGVDYLGFIDLHHRAEGVLVLQDHKTSSDPRKYGLHERADYLNDPQTLLYARYLLDTQGDYSLCVQWIYYATKGKPRVVTTPVLLTRAEVEAAFVNVVHKPATEMVQIRKKGVDGPPPPRNTDSCYSYGQPCPHMAYCKPLDGDNEDMSSFDDFFADETPKAPTPTATKAPAKDLLADLESEETPKAAPKAQKATKAKDPINPPEKPAGVGLEPQGIGTPTKAFVSSLADVAKTDNGKALLLSVADLLTKIANAL